VATPDIRLDIDVVVTHRMPLPDLIAYARYRNLTPYEEILQRSLLTDLAELGRRGVDVMVQRGQRQLAEERESRDDETRPGRYERRALRALGKAHLARWRRSRPL